LFLVCVLISLTYSFNILSIVNLNFSDIPSKSQITSKLSKDENFLFLHYLKKQDREELSHYFDKTQASHRDIYQSFRVLQYIDQLEGNNGHEMSKGTYQSMVQMRERASRDFYQRLHLYLSQTQSNLIYLSDFHSIKSLALENSSLKLELIKLLGLQEFSKLDLSRDFIKKL